MPSIKLAEALLRRKELSEKVKQLLNLKERQVYYEIRGERKKISEGLDELNLNYPKLDVNQVTAEYDFYARQLRLIDAAIQQVNWTATVELENSVMSDYVSKS